MKVESEFTLQENVNLCQRIDTVISIIKELGDHEILRSKANTVYLRRETVRKARVFEGVEGVLRRVKVRFEETFIF
jgi:hypothetical protein